MLSHYYSDPLMPFHTGQSPAENNIHRAAEWSICKTYEELRRIAEEQIGLPEIDAPRGSNWLEAMVIEGANISHRCYDALVKQYDFAAGRQDPPAGLNAKCRQMLARLLRHAAVGFACILDEAIEEADIRAPRCDLTVATFLATVKMPVRWITNKLADAEDRAAVDAMYREYEATGKVEKNLPEDDRVVRDLVAKELGAEAKRPTRSEEPAPASALPQSEEKPAVNVTQPEDVSHPPDHPILSMTTPEIAQLPSDKETEQFEQLAVASAADKDFEQLKQTELRFYLQRGSDVVDAPSIGPKTAKRLRKIGVRTVNDLLQLDPDEAAGKLNARHITREVLADWQDQAALVCCIPRIRGHDAQIMVACGYRDAESVAAADCSELLAETAAFAETVEGQCVIRSSDPPDREEVANWITWAQQARPLKAA